MVPALGGEANREQLRAVARRFGWGSLVALAVLIATGAAGLKAASWFGFLAVVLASVNIFGGFTVTQRMLGMYRKRG